MRERNLISFLFVLATIVVCKTATCLAQDTDAANDNDETCQQFAPLGPPDEYAESSQPGIRLAVRRWEPTDGNIKSVLVVHHGGCGWHSGYFDVLGKRLASNGIAVVAYDHVGAGYSDSMDGYRQYFDSMDTLHNDLSKMVEDAREKYKGKRVFCLGESFGGMVLLHHMLQDPNADGYILSGPLIRIREEMLPPKFVQSIVQFLSSYFPHFKMPGTDFMSSFDEAFGDSRWADAGRADPLIQEAASTPPRLGMIASAVNTSSSHHLELKARCGRAVCHFHWRRRCTRLRSRQ